MTYKFKEKKKLCNFKPNFTLNSKFLCKENLTALKLPSDLLKIFYHLCSPSYHKRLNTEDKKIKPYFEVLICSMMFDFLISLRTDFRR